MAYNMGPKGISIVGEETHRLVVMNKDFEEKL